MKKLYTLGSVVMLIMIFFGCEEVKDPAGQRNIGIVPLISDVSGIFINGDPASSVQFKVDLSAGMTVEKGEIEVSRQGNFERVKIKELSSFPSTVTFALGEIADKLGNISRGDVISLEVLTSNNGITTRSNAALALIVYCEYTPALAVGSYHSVSPPSDWSTEGDIVITADPNDPYTVNVKGLETIDGNIEDKGKLVMHIDPANFQVTADKTVLASESYWGDTNIAYEGTGTFNSCSGTYSMSFDISSDQGDYGAFLFTFTRN
jgi:hypothetical protein